MRALPPRRHRDNKAKRFTVNGALPAYLVIRMLSEQLRDFDIDLQVVTEPNTANPLGTNPTHIGGQDNYLCLLTNSINGGHEKPVKQTVKKKSKPNPKPKPDRPLSYREKVEWFVANHYETGMELEIMIESLKDDDLENFFWYNEKVHFPKMLSDLKKEKEDE